MKVFFPLLFVYFTAAVWAQNPQEEVFRHPLRQETLSAFTLTCARLAEHPLIRGNFEQEKKLNRLNRSLKSSGNFIIAPEQGMVWDTAAPFPSTLTLGRDYLIQSRPGGQRTVVGAQGNETFLRMAEVLSAVFTGNSRNLLDNFEVYYTGSPAGWELGLTPLNRAIVSFAERIIMKGDTAIRFIEIHEQSGDTTQYILTNHNYPAELNDYEKALFSLP